MVESAKDLRVGHTVRSFDNELEALAELVGDELVADEAGAAPRSA